MITRRSLAAALAAAGALTGSVAAHAANGAPRRVVAAGGAVTETVFALGAGDRIIAVDSTSLFPDPVRDLPQIGYLRALAPEGLISLSPDLLLLSDEAGPPQALAVLRAAGAPLAMVPDAAGVDGVVRKIEVIATVLGLDGKDLAQTVAADWRSLDAPLAEVPPVRALFVLSAARGAPLASGGGTHADAMLRAARATNVVTAFEGYRPLSAEAAAQLAPEAVVMMAHALDEAGGVDAVLSMPALAVTPAARARRVVALEGSYLLNFGPRAAHARRDLARLLHPNATLPELPRRSWT